MSLKEQLKATFRGLWILCIGLPFAIGLFPLLIFPGFRKFCFLSGEKPKEKSNDIYRFQIPINLNIENIDTDNQIQLEEDLDKRIEEKVEEKIKEILVKTKDKEKEIPGTSEMVETDKKKRANFLELD